jgi:hypothetical protein
MLIECAYCGTLIEKMAGEVNRARKAGAHLYCDRTCAGFGRRKGKTSDQKKEEKRLYDIEYRAKNAERKKETNHAWYKRTYDPVKAALERKKKMRWHVDYCRRPEYKKWKREYDKKYRAKKMFADMWEPFLVLVELKKVIADQASRYEIYRENQTLNKTQERKRDYERLNSNKPERGSLGYIERG